MTDSYVVKFLLEKTAPDRSSTIRWEQDSSGSFIAEFRGLKISLLGGEMALTILTITDGPNCHVIQEDRWIHPSQSRLGKFLNGIAKRLGREPVFKPPEDFSDKTKEEIRALLDNLYRKVSEQYGNLHQPEDREKIREKILQKLTGL